MDRLIYTAMPGAQHILDQQASVANNLANATSTGFKAQIDSFKAMPIKGGQLETRTFAVSGDSGIDFKSGGIEKTGATFDVAVQGQGWFSVQRANGTEGLTRNGNFKVSENGILQTASGLSVMGDGGPVTIPPNTTVEIGADGTISGSTDGQKPVTITVLGRLKLVNPPEVDIVRGADGLFDLKTGASAPVDANVRVVQGAIEASNVSLVQSMVNMIALAREFDMHMKILQGAEGNDSKASQLMQLG